MGNHRTPLADCVYVRVLGSGLRSFGFCKPAKAIPFEANVHFLDIFFVLVLNLKIYKLLENGKRGRAQTPIGHTGTLVGFC